MFIHLFAFTMSDRCENIHPIVFILKIQDERKQYFLFTCLELSKKNFEQLLNEIFLSSAEGTDEPKNKK